MAAPTGQPAARPAREPIVVNLPLLRRGIRIFFFYSCAVLLTGVVSLMFADLLWRTGWSTSRTVLLVLFIILFFLVAIGCVHGIFGFLLRVFGDKARITSFADYSRLSIEGTSTAIIIPIYNEDVPRVYEGIRATYESLRATGQLERFDFFILSDSTPTPTSGSRRNAAGMRSSATSARSAAFTTAAALTTRPRKAGTSVTSLTPGAAATATSSVSTPTASCAATPSCVSCR
jgi:membrane glycosyltransferase